MNEFDKKRLATLLSEQKNEGVENYALVVISNGNYFGTFPLIETLKSEEFSQELEDAGSTEIRLVTHKEVHEKYSEGYDLIGIDFSTIGPRPVLRKRND